MGKKKGKREGGNPSLVSGGAASSASLIGLSKRGWKTFISGSILLLLGFLTLSLTDARGQNWASTLSPILILAGYVFMGFGLILKDRLPHSLSPQWNAFALP